MQTTRMTMLGAAAALWLGASLAGAQTATGTPRGHDGFMADRMARVLGLTDDQKAAFQKVLDQQKPQMQALRQQMRDNHQKLQDALAAANPDPAAVGQVVIQGHQLGQQARTLRDQASQSLRALLTPEQQTKFDALQSLRQNGRGWGRGFGGWGGPHARKGGGAPQGTPQP